MGKLLRWILVTLVVLFVMAACILGGVYVAAKQVPEFYEEAIACNAEEAAAANDEMLARAAALASEIKKEGVWKATFSEDHINGWLAVDLPTNHPETLPKGITEPRVRLEKDRVLVGFRFTSDSFSGVLSLEAEVYWTDDARLAIAVQSLRAGVMPVPISLVLQPIRDKLAKTKWQIQWVDQPSGPVALVTVPPVEDGRLIRNVEALRVEPQELYISGTTGPKPEGTPAAEPSGS